MPLSSNGSPGALRRLLAALATASGLALLATTALAQAPTPPGETTRVAPPRRPPPPPLLIVPEARIPVRLESATVRTLIVGATAKTRIEFTLYNPNERVLEGELQFPLLERQTVTGMALDIEGQLREAVAVPKAKGRQVFDDVTRQQVDPALLQMSKGNNYSLRVYPLPARGRRQVALELSEPLDLARAGAGKPAAATLRLPLNFAERIAKLDVEVSLPGVAPSQVAATWRASRPARSADGQGGTVVRLQQSPAEAGGGELVVQRAHSETSFVSTELFRGKRYFYAELPASTESQPRAVPRTLGLVWDASGSGARRSREQELTLLDAYFRRLGKVDVALRVVRDVAEPDERFEVRDGQWQALRKRLAGLVYDGASNPGAMTVPAGAELGLLVSDGLFNYGDAPLPKPQQPLLIVGSGAGADLTLLRRSAEASGGELVDLDGLLARMPLAEAAAEGTRLLTRQRSHLATLDGVGTAELIAASRYEEGGRFVVAGVLLQPTAELRLGLVSPAGVKTTRSLRINENDGAARNGTAIAAQQWARLRWAELAEDELRQAKAMERLGLQFNLLTPQTSLIVLDNGLQYARYGIAPPASDKKLFAEYESIVALMQRDEERARSTQLARVTRDFEQRVQWWQREFPKDAPPEEMRPRATAMAVGAAAPAPGFAPPPAPAPAPAPPPAPVATSPAAARAAAQAAAAERERAEATQRRAASAASEARSAEAAAKAAAAGGGAGSSTTIALKKWAPDSAYARRMREAAPQDVYAIYLDERPNYENSTAFFLDAADILLDKGQPLLAARVASNLAEMKLEDRHILRILAYRLLQFGRVELALPVLQRVLALAPDEPQSWRDLALAQRSAGAYQRAVDNLWHIVTQPWQGRFPGIEVIALSELNAIVAEARNKGQALNTEAIPATLLQNLPVAMRTVLSWDADNTDIDLWVTDPNGERAYYGRQLTYQGGLMSRDFTGGYGPEEFSLRDPKPGTYKVQAQFYGHRQQIVAPSTTLMLQFISGFGTPQEKQQSVILRLSGREQIVDVGEFEVKAPQ
ncbi:VIT domain-containing protein [Roseateles violae]|uniref:VIT domain-containing protein n=1 Tax=Roseateles violae TaxID=3058042 RepID=A0ABT8DRG5_9BURK|nr:VIT domain-containing protein [Pelomonas sp. PFR6]MDN3919635.1 VIT domain-containing protein [Pelomonas sp. PFR6]